METTGTAVKLSACDKGERRGDLASFSELTQLSLSF